MIMWSKIGPVRVCEIFWIKKGGDIQIRIVLDDEECLISQELKELKMDSYDECHEIIYGF